MSEEKPNKVRIRLYEYFLYWFVTAVLLILAVPLMMLKFIAYLIRSMGAPLKSVKNFVGFVLVILIVAAAFTAYEILMPYDIGQESRSVVIEENDSFADALTALKENGILKGEYLFKFMTVASGVDKSLIPGRYDFSGRVSLYSIWNKFRRHEIATVLVTIPEGLTLFKTASILAQNIGIDSSAFVTRAFDTVYTQEKYGLNGLEGYLFPETYRFWYGINIDQTIKVLVSQFNHRTVGLFDSLSQDARSKEEVVVLASIIEAEARDGDEKGLISSVYHNRLARGMRLQADPTVIYALGGLERPLYYHDLESDSPYNTYKHKGLPPGPINSPGLDAIKAALMPEETDYLYFVADGTGRHLFSKTLTEHNRAKNRIKKERRVNGPN